jgi:peptide-methionine (S)-S-oxide reductase
VVQVAVAQDRPTPDTDQGQPERSSAPKKSAAVKGKARRANAGNKSTAATGDFSAAAVPKTELATFGAGCFWHVEDAFEHQKGVLNAVSGYSGGNIADPSYEMVHTGQTGHAECVQVEYDPTVISYEKLLKIFWSCHDPTSINRQGEDEGPQYRSVIFFHSEEQRKAALKSYEQLTSARAYRLPIVTQLVPKQQFFPAEDYHQNYYSGLRRPAARRRKAVAPKAKVVQRKSSSAARTAQNSQSAGTLPNSGSSALSQKRAESESDSSSSSDPSSRSVENSAPK